MHGFRKDRPHRLFALAGALFGLAAASKWSGLFPLGARIAIVALVRLMQSWRTLFADARPEDWYRPDSVAGLQGGPCRAMLRGVAGDLYLATFVPLHGLSPTELIEAQRRIFSDNTTTAIAGHTYQSGWPSWPFLVRPVWFLFDKIAENNIAAIVFLGNPLVLWPALLALVVVARDVIVARRWDAFLILSFYLGPYLAWALLPRSLAFLYYYLPAASVTSLALVYVLRRGKLPGWLLWAYVGVAAIGFAIMLPVSRRLHRRVDGDLQPADDFSELDIDTPAAGGGGRVVSVRFRRKLLRGGVLEASMFTTWTRRLIGSAPFAVVLQLGLAVADGDEISAVEAVVLDQVLLDGVGATLRQPLIVLSPPTASV